MHAAARAPMDFHALQDGRLFEHAPRLPVSDAEIALAGSAVNRAWKHLPRSIRTRLGDRRNREGHPVNVIRYYPFPVLVDNGRPGALDRLHAWGEAYARIIARIADAYQQQLPAVRRFLHHAVIKHLPPHLVPLIQAYKTRDLLAGAHLGDDFLAGRSVEWNLGAVGGLDEGWQTARQVLRDRRTPDPAQETLLPVETDPVPHILKALRWAYESFCLANGRTPVPNPYTLFLEHDDLYGSTVSVCARLRDWGERTDLAFQHELAFHDQRLTTAEGRRVDLVSMDCHWEDLQGGHPLIQAARKNVVALDCSPFAHLVLRSKALLALLWTPRFQRAVGLAPEETKTLERHLMPTALWRRATFSGNPFLPSKAFRALCPRMDLPPPRDKPPASQKRLPSFQPAGLVVKTAIGATYGGGGVATVLPEAGHEARDAARLVQDTLRGAASQTRLPGTVVLSATHGRLKSTLKQAVLQGLTGLGPQGARGDLGQADDFWKALVPAWEQRLAEKPRAGDLTAAARRLAEQHLGVSLDTLQAERPARWKPVAKSLEKGVQKARQGKDPFALCGAVQCLGDFLALCRFQETAFQERYRRFMQGLTNMLDPAETLTHQDLYDRLSRRTERFFQQALNASLPDKARDALHGLLQEPYLARQHRVSNPIVFQPFLLPERLSGEEEPLDVVSRTHILFTRNGPRVLVAGGQVFYAQAGKPDNRSKMTASFWLRRPV